MNADDRAGKVVAAAGDIDGDGLDDVLVGAPQNDDGGTNAGKAYIVLGQSLGSAAEIDLADADYNFEGDSASRNFGHSLAGAQDVDGDGLDDILIGTPYYVAAINMEGAAALFTGASLGTSPDVTISEADSLFVGENEDDKAGWSVALPGDIDGDGLADLVVGAYGTDSPNSGTAYVLLAPNECASE